MAGIDKKTRGKRRKPFSKEKAKKILSEDKPTLHGEEITEKQRGLLGLIAGGGTPSKKKGFRG